MQNIYFTTRVPKKKKKRKQEEQQGKEHKQITLTGM